MSHSATEDYYATLGVEPRSEAAAIRAAYLALMRLYHPDKNDSPAAIERAHAIIAAFAVLGDVEKRLHYDWGRRRAAEAAALRPRWSLSRLPRPLVAAVLALLVLAPFAMIQSPLTVRDPLVATTAPAAVIGHDPISLAKEDAIATPLATPAPIAASTPAVVASPSMIEPRAAEPRPRVADVPVVPALAPRVPAARRAPPKARNDVTTPTPATRANAKCRFAKPGAEAAICNNNNLAALDLNVVTFYNQSLIFGAATKRDALLDSRASFLARREQCRSDACLQSLHLDHLREMSTIVENRLRDPLR